MSGNNGNIHAKVLGSNEKVQAHAEINTAQGHSASVGATHIPKHNMTVIDAGGKANLWQSKSGDTTLDLTGSAQRHTSGPFAGKNNFGAGMGVTHRF